jgi:hypothetical protein
MWINRSQNSGARSQNGRKKNSEPQEIKYSRIKKEEFLTQINAGFRRLHFGKRRNGGDFLTRIARVSLR